MTRPRLRDLGINIGRFPIGQHNAITDVPDVWVGHKTLVYDAPRVARTGVTVILPRKGEIWSDNAYAAYHSLNGCGEMTGVHWITESGMLSTPIALTNTGQVGTVHEALCAYAQEFGHTDRFSLPVVAETYDGWLNDMEAFHVSRTDVYEAIAQAATGPVAEGSVGGGAGMICYEFKGGIGTASRVVELPTGEYAVGALVQANHGDRIDLRIDGRAMGELLGPEVTPTPWGVRQRVPVSSIIVILATNAPLLPFQCRRLAQRATIGFARTGGMGHNGSGDIFLAFATGNHLPHKNEAAHTVQTLPNHHLNDLFVATTEAVEEAILNVLCAADTMVGFKDRTAYGLPVDRLRELMAT
ncbi:MAG: P1 family peptidase [Caldilineales bacterium]|nr:P1 family peptidase [Caldilineales bacterium]